MSEQLDRLEGMMTKLISTVGNIMENQTLMRGDLNIVKEQLGNVESRLDNVESRLGNVESRLDNVESGLGNVESRLDNVESRLGNVESRLDNMEKESMTRHREAMEKLNSLEADQEHIWQKAVRNEREFARFKIQHGF